MRTGDTASLAALSTAAQSTSFMACESSAPAPGGVGGIVWASSQFFRAPAVGVACRELPGFLLAPFRRVFLAAALRRENSSLFFVAYSFCADAIWSALDCPSYASKASETTPRQERELSRLVQRWV